MVCWGLRSISEAPIECEPQPQHSCKIYALRSIGVNDGTMSAHSPSVGQTPELGGKSNKTKHPYSSTSVLIVSGTARVMKVPPKFLLVVQLVSGFPVSMKKHKQTAAGNEDMTS